MLDIQPQVPFQPDLPVLLLRAAVVFPRTVATLELEPGEGEGGPIAAFGPFPAGLPRLAEPAADAGAPEQLQDTLLVALPWASAPPEGVLGTPPSAGTLSRIVLATRLGGGRLRLVLEGLERVRVRALRTVDGELRALVEPGPLPAGDPDELRRGLDRVLGVVRELAGLGEDRAGELLELLTANAGDPGHCADLAAAHLELSLAARRRLLRELEPGARLAALGEALEGLRASAEVRRGLEEGVRRRRRLGYLREQLAVIQRELGQADPHEREAQELERRSETVPMSAGARRLWLRELAHFRRAAPASPEAGHLRAYLEWTLELPWDPAAGSPEPGPGRGASQFARVSEQLSRSHSALDEVKLRVIEFLAVRRLRGDTRGAVLCFMGPPGTGKSSMGRAVAAALGRAVIEIPVGSLTEEEELSGSSHRREGGQPGLILQGLHRAGSGDPVLLIDEIDKLALGGNASSSGALLRILDPDQNAEFLDHYLGVPFDLSQCLILATANDEEEIPEALLDRLEVIEFGGYTESEKLTIAREHLIPRSRARAGLDRRQLRVSPAALRSLVRSYTEESGVRHLQRLLDSLARKAAVKVVRGGPGLYVKRGDLLELVGPASVEEDLPPRRSAVGVSTGLAWTSAGGSLLPVEAISMPGSGRTLITGQLGDVMRESVQTAISYVRTCFPALGLEPDLLDSLDVHFHFPSAATPKDGPSAGLAIATALVSLLTRVTTRNSVAMTGEITLRGDVLAVGGVRDKLLAAVRGGLREAVVPARNSEEVLRLPGEIRSGIQIHLVTHAREVFELALSRDVGLSRGSPTLADLRRRPGSRRASRRRGRRPAS